MLHYSRRVCAALAACVAVSWATFSNYDTLSASQKLDYLWQNVMADTKGDSFMNPLKTILEVSNPANLWAMSTTHADWRDKDHHKATHGIGAHAKAHFEWKTNAYTGMFQRADHCVIRMANAAAPGGIAMTSYGPNLAVKCLRDGAESANMQFIWQVDGYAVLPKGAQNTCSYFEAPLSNHNPLRDDIAMPLRDTFISAFQDIDPQSMLLGVSQLASGTQSGTAGDIKDPLYPFALVLKPAAGLNMVGCRFTEPISQLRNLAAAGWGPGTSLYEVYAVFDPLSAEADSRALQHIGDLVLDSVFTPSTYGDTQLFFRHSFFKEELALLKSTDPARAAVWSNYVTNDTNYKREGANIYWPLLPGGTEEIAALAARPMAQMLEGDITVNV